MESFSTTLNGALFGLSLIVAIGPQNAFVLRQGLMRHNVAAVVAICVASDVALMVLGVGGVGTAIANRPLLADVMRIGGATFLAGYAVVAFRRAMTTQAVVLAGGPTPTLAASVSCALAFTWLNPHVYLDTVVLLGVVAHSQTANAAWFATGAALSSLMWFTALGFGARLLRPAFANPMATRALDCSIAVVMMCISVSLLVQGVAQ